MIGSVQNAKKSILDSMDMIIEWLLEGDVSIQYQVHRDLLQSDLETQQKLQNRIEKEGWGEDFLSKQNYNGHWGLGYYQPKWISSHYTLLDLRNLGIAKNNNQCKKSIDVILKNEKGPDGGINPSGTIKNSDVCMNGMFLNCAFLSIQAEI